MNEVKLGKELGYRTTNKYILTACIKCGNVRWVRLKKGQPKHSICRSCASKFINWKGGRTIERKGYVRIKLQPTDFFYPMAWNDGYVYEHRLVVARALGRCLHRWEVIHHKEGYAKDDNRYPQTLQPVTDDRHNQITILEKRIRYLEDRVTLLEVDNASLRTQTKIGVPE